MREKRSEREREKDGGRGEKHKERKILPDRKTNT